MFRFFRQFRETMLTENKYHKYFLYVVGEIFIVIIGILLALQVDTWNHEREDREEAKVFLRRLKGEFMTNRQQLVQKITMRNQALASARELIRFVDGDSGDYSVSQVDSLLVHARRRARQSIWARHRIVTWRPP